MKKKILIYISSDYYYYHFKFGAYDELKKHHNIKVLLNKNNCSKNPKLLKGFNYSFVRLSKKIDKNYMRALYLGMCHHRIMSKSFRYLFRRYFPNIIDFLKKQKYLRSEKIKKGNIFFFYIFNLFKYFNILNKEKFFYRRLILQLFSLNPLYNFIKKKFIINGENDITLLKKIKKYNPDLILYATHCFESESIILCKISNCINKKILFLIDNWDNISSKTLFFLKPNAVTVWGKQSRNSAIKIQCMKNENIYHLGNPKFASYFEIRKKKLKSPYPFPYVLFLGVLQPYNEINCLQILDDEIENNKQIYQNLKIIYRPHPGREYMIKIAKKIKFKNIFFDLKMEEFLKSKIKYLLNEDNYFEKLIQNSLFMVGGITTVSIESVIFKKRYLFMAHDEKNNITSPKNMYSNFIHYDEILKLKLLKKCDTLDKLNLYFKKLYKLSSSKIDDKKNDNEINYFYDISKTNYSKELNNIVIKLFSERI